MSDAQNEETIDENLDELDAIEQEVIESSVNREEAPIEKRKGSTGIFFLLILLGGIGAAGWYYQSLWLPQATTKIQAWMHDFMPDSATETAEVVKHEETKVVLEPVESVEAEVPVKVEIAKVEAAEVETAEVELTEPEIIPSDVDVPVQDEVVADVPARRITPPPIYALPDPTFYNNVPAEFPQHRRMPALMPQTLTAAEIENLTISDARVAFWQRNLPKAEMLYKHLSEGEQTSANNWGELGNVYYLQAKWHQAAMAYTEAALLLLDKQQIPQAMFLRYIVSGLDATQLQRIDEHLRNLQAPVQG